MKPFTLDGLLPKTVPPDGSFQIIAELPDGRVELQVGGAESEVFAFLDSVMDSELRSHIDKQTRAAMTEPVTARGFDIRHD